MTGTTFMTQKHNRIFLNKNYLESLILTKEPQNKLIFLNDAAIIQNKNFKVLAKLLAVDETPSLTRGKKLERHQLIIKIHKNLNLSISSKIGLILECAAQKGSPLYFSPGHLRELQHFKKVQSKSKQFNALVIIKVIFLSLGLCNKLRPECSELSLFEKPVYICRQDLRLRLKYYFLIRAFFEITKFNFFYITYHYYLTFVEQVDLSTIVFNNKFNSALLSLPDELILSEQEFVLNIEQLLLSSGILVEREVPFNKGEEQELPYFEVNSDLAEFFTKFKE